MLANLKYSTRKPVILFLFIWIALGLTACQSLRNLDVETETAKGIRQYEADSLNAAIKTLSRAIKLDETCSDCYMYRGFSYKAREEYNQALNDLNAYINLNETDAIGYANRGSIHYMMQNYDLALDDFQTALVLKPGFYQMYNTVSHMYWATGKKEECCRYYRKALYAGDSTFDKRIIEYCNSRKE